MTPGHRLARATARCGADPAVVLLAAASLLVTAGCAGAGAGSSAPAGTAASTRPAAKNTCRDVSWNPPPALQVRQTHRELVGFGPTLLGVDTTWAGGGFQAETVAGGYVDDLTEPYDDLEVTGSLTTADGTEAEVSHGSLRGVPVVLVIWRDASEKPPCDVHALLVQGADPTTEHRLLDALG